MTLLDIAFLKNVSPGMIALVSSIPAIVFSIYVIVDDRRQAKAHHGPADGHGGPAGHATPTVSPPLSHGEPNTSTSKAH